MLTGKEYHLQKMHLEINTPALYYLLSMQRCNREEFKHTSGYAISVYPCKVIQFCPSKKMCPIGHLKEA